MAAPVRRICLAYSGGLDTSVILCWLKERYDAEIVAFCADLGQEEELDGLPEKARKTGAVDCVIDDLRLLPHMWLLKTSSGKIARAPNLKRFLEVFGKSAP